MTIHRTMSEIKSSLMKRIEQHSNKESLEIIVQVEDYDDLYDAVVLLYGSSGALLVDETYTVGRSETDSTVDATILLSNVMVWTADEAVSVNQQIREVCH